MKEINSEESPQQVALTARKVGEVVTSTFSAVASALDYPIGNNSKKKVYL